MLLKIVVWPPSPFDVSGNNKAPTVTDGELAVPRHFATQLIFVVFAADKHNGDRDTSAPQVAAWLRDLGT